MIDKISVYPVSMRQAVNIFAGRDLPVPRPGALFAVGVGDATGLLGTAVVGFPFSEPTIDGDSLGLAEIYGLAIDPMVDGNCKAAVASALLRASWRATKAFGFYALGVNNLNLLHLGLGLLWLGDSGFKFRANVIGGRFISGWFRERKKPQKFPVTICPVAPAWAVAFLGEAHRSLPLTEIYWLGVRLLDEVCGVIGFGGVMSLLGGDPAALEVYSLGIHDHDDDIIYTCGRCLAAGVRRASNALGYERVYGFTTNTFRNRIMMAQSGFLPASNQNRTFTVEGSMVPWVWDRAVKK